MTRPIPIDDEHVGRIELRAAHKRGEHEHLFVDECPECQAEHDALLARGR